MSFYTVNIVTSEGEILDSVNVSLEDGQGDDVANISKSIAKQYVMSVIEDAITEDN